MQAKAIQALWLYMPPYINSTADILITSIASTASSRRRRLQATAGSADVTTELDVGSAQSVAATSTHLTSVVSSSKFLVSNCNGHALPVDELIAWLCFLTCLAAHPVCVITHAHLTTRSHPYASSHDALIFSKQSGFVSCTPPRVSLSGCLYVGAPVAKRRRFHCLP